jgi:hypothetical protein
VDHGARLDGGLLAYPVIQMGCDPYRPHHLAEELTDRIRQRRRFFGSLHVVNV